MSFKSKFLRKRNTECPELTCRSCGIIILYFIMIHNWKWTFILKLAVIPSLCFKRVNDKQLICFFLTYIFVSITSGMLNFPYYYWYDIYQSLMLFWSKNVGSLDFITTGVPGSIYVESTSVFTCISDLAWLLTVFYTFLIGILYKLHLLVYILIFQYCVQL